MFPKGFPGDSAGKESACNVGDVGSIPGLGRSPGEGKGYPLQCSGLENSMDWIVHGVTKPLARLSDSLTHSFMFPKGANDLCCIERHILLTTQFSTEILA